MLRLLGLIALAFLLFVPGWATWLLFHHKDKGDGSGSSTVRNLFTQVAAGITIDSLLALVLAFAGVFSLWLFSACVIGYSALALAFSSPRLSLAGLGLPRPGKLARQSWVLLVALVIGLALFMLPFMFAFGGSDEGIYPNTAGNILRTGSVFFNDPVVPTVKPQDRDMFYLQAYQDVNGKSVYSYSVQEAGLFISSFKTGKITPQFFYLFPSLMAVFMGFIGLRGGFFVLTLLALMSAWAVFLIAEEVMDRWAAGVASIFLVVNFLEVYFAKFSTSEMATQFFFLLGLYGFLRMRRGDGGDRTESAWWGVLAAAGFGGMLLARVDSFLVLVPLGLAYWFYFVKDGVRAIRRDLVFLLVLMGLGLFALGLMLGPYHTYVSSAALGQALPWLPGGTATAAGIVAGGVILALLSRGPLKKVYPALLKHRRAILAVACLLLLALFVYLLFIRPAIPVKVGATPNLRVPEFATRGNQYTLPYFAYYVTPLGMLLIVLGYLLFIYSDLNARNLLLPLSGLVVMLIFSYRHMLEPLLVFWMRRLVPVALPVAVLMQAFAVFWLWRKAKQSWSGSRSRMLAVRTGLACVVVVLVALCFSYSVRLAWIKGHTQSLPTVTKVAALAPAPALIVCDEQTGNTFGAPLRCFYGRSVVTLRNPDDLASERFFQFVDSREKKGQLVYILANIDSKLPKADSGKLDLAKQDVVVEHTRVMPQTPKPSLKLIDWDYVVELYKVTPKKQPQ